MIKSNKINFSTGVTFMLSGGQQYHSFRSFNLLLLSVDIEKTKAKLHQIDIPGMNGVLDVTDHFGQVTYENRKILLTFEGQDTNYNEWENTRSSIETVLSGQYVAKVILDTDPNYHWKGRATVIAEKNTTFRSTLQIEIDAYPKKIDSSGREYL